MPALGRGRGCMRVRPAPRLQVGNPAGGGGIRPGRPILAPPLPAPPPSGHPSLARPAPHSPAHQGGDDHAPGCAAAVGVQVLLALAPPAAQPEGVEEQEEEVQGEAGQRGGPQQQQRLCEVGRRCWRCGRAPSSAAPVTLRARGALSLNHPAAPGTLGCLPATPQTPVLKPCTSHQDWT